MIDIEVIVKRNAFSLTVKEQFGKGITGIFGPSGSGKTTLLYALAGLVNPDLGKIFIQNRCLFHKDKKINIPVEKRGIGYVFQEGRLFPHLSVKQNLLYGFNKLKNKPIISFEETIEMLALESLLENRPSDISGGERQRTALGRALLSSPGVMLLDEPFSAVDMQLRGQIIPFLLRIHNNVNIPMLVVSHDLPDLLKLTNDICIIKQGHVLGHGDYHQLLKNKDVAAFFGSGSLVNSVEMNVAHAYPADGLTILSHPGDKSEVRVKCEKSKDVYSVGQKLKIFIQAEDIALSLKKIPDVTIQNQLKGKIKDIIEKETTSICLVDVGFVLLVEITIDSRKRMEITIGTEVWCLFKSVAIDVAR